MNFPILTMPRRLLDMENLFTSTIDIFDPFDELDQELCRDILWLRKPILHRKKRKSNVPSKYRLNIDVHGYKPESLKTEINDGKLVVSGYDEVQKGEDYTKKEFRKSFQLPENVDEEKFISFVTKKGNMIIEIPYKQDVKRLEPVINEKEDGSGTLVYTMDVKGLDLPKLQVTLKDYDVIINYEELLQLTGGKTTRITNVKEFKLPDNADVKSLKCTCENEKLIIEAILLPESLTMKKIPIYFEKQDYGEESVEQVSETKVEESRPEEIEKKEESEEKKFEYPSEKEKISEEEGKKDLLQEKQQVIQPEETVAQQEQEIVKPEVQEQPEVPSEEPEKAEQQSQETEQGESKEVKTSSSEMQIQSRRPMDVIEKPFGAVISKPEQIPFIQQVAETEEHPEEKPTKKIPFESVQFHYKKLSEEEKENKEVMGEKEETPVTIEEPTITREQKVEESPIIKEEEKEYHEEPIGKVEEEKIPSEEQKVSVKSELLKEEQSVEQRTQPQEETKQLESEEPVKGFEEEKKQPESKEPMPFESEKEEKKESLIDLPEKLEQQPEEQYSESEKKGLVNE